MINTSRSNIKAQLVANSVQEMTAAQVWLYPNPAKNEVRIELAGNGGAVLLELYDVAGRLLTSRKTSDKIITLNIAAYAAGVYFVRVINENVQADAKLLIER